MQQNPSCDALCLIGVEAVEVTAAIDWLDDEPTRKLFLVNCQLKIEHSRIESFSAGSMLECRLAANGVGWGAAMRSLAVQAAPGFEELAQRIQDNHQAAYLLLMEVADFGLQAFANARQNWKQNGPFVPLAALKKRFFRVPAIICGAGPSLEEALPTLAADASKALLLSSGTACALLSKHGIAPHLACALDKRTPPSKLQAIQGSICCMQSRLNPLAAQEWPGIKILARESGPLPWESWWLGEEQERIESGWTAGNFATQIALYLGCDPIIWTGMDFCYRGSVKYAKEFEQDKAELFQVPNRKGQMVLTQRDWLMAARWQQALAERHPERRWICTAKEGLPLGEGVETLFWKESRQLLSQEVDAQGRLQALLQEASRIEIETDKEEKWQESVKRAKDAADRLDEDLLEEEPVYRFFLAPLWAIWQPILEQNGGGLQRLLFFQNVLAAM